MNSEDLDGFSGRIKSVVPKMPLINKDEHYYAKAYYKKLAKYIIDFEASLSDEEEVGARLVTFGESITIHIEDIGYSNPRLICFYGRDNNDQEVQLIQHVNQISVLLIKVKRIDTSRQRIGYKLKEELNTES